MTVTPFQELACPLDGGPLQRHGSTWRCPAGHCFDIAGQGYTNLLPVQNKRSRDPGDSKEMVAARRRFLDAGHYQAIAVVVSQAALADLPATASAACLDAGCGEGYYLRQLAAAAVDGPALALLGLDISKWAVLAAAKRGQHHEPGRQVSWVVGSNARLPVLPATIDRLLCVFGFPVHAEFARVIKSGGELLQLDAGPNHLRELREIVYPTLKPDRSTDQPAPAGFSRLSTKTIAYALDLIGSQPIADLLAMTPHLYRASNARRARAAELTALSLTVDVRLTRFRRDAAG